MTAAGVGSEASRTRGCRTKVRMADCRMAFGESAKASRPVGARQTASRFSCTSPPASSQGILLGHAARLQVFWSCSLEAVETLMAS